MKKNGLTVKQLLKAIDEDREVNVILYAYGQYYASTFADGMHNVRECLENMNKDCINALVFDVCPGPDGDHIKIKAEIVH